MSMWNTTEQSHKVPTLIARPPTIERNLWPSYMVLYGGICIFNSLYIFGLAHTS